MTDRHVRSFGAVAAILLIAGTFLYYRLREPPTHSVDGQYFSDNCGIMTISRETAEFDGQRARFKILFDKFGLVGKLDRPLGPFYVQSPDGSKEPPSLIFGENSVRDYSRTDNDASSTA